MEPTFYSDNILVTERISKRIPFFERGDIVIAKSPIEPLTMICKRIRGLPGDKIHIKPQYSLLGGSTSTITVDAKSNRRSKIALAFGTFDPFDGDDDEQINNQDSSSGKLLSRTIIVPRGHVWLEGDNSDNSMDSRYYGPVPMGLIQSRVFCRLLPFKDFGAY